MLRALTLIAALVSAPAWAGGPGFAISGASVVGVPGLPELSTLSSKPCGVSGRTTINVTFTDPDGISYAAVEVRSTLVRPAVSNQERTWLWIPAYARQARGYRWRYEDQGTLRTRHTIDIAIDLLPGVGPIPARILAKDGRGAMTISDIALVPAVCR